MTNLYHHTSMIMQIATVRITQVEGVSDPQYHWIDIALFDDKGNLVHKTTVFSPNSAHYPSIEFTSDDSETRGEDNTVLDLTADEEREIDDALLDDDAPGPDPHDVYYEPDNKGFAGGDAAFGGDEQGDTDDPVTHP